MAQLRSNPLISQTLEALRRVGLSDEQDTVKQGVKHTSGYVRVK